MTQMTDYLQYGLMASHVYADYRQPLSIDSRPMKEGEQVGFSAYNVNAGLGSGWNIAKISDYAPFNVKFGGNSTTYAGGAIDSLYWQKRVWEDAKNNSQLTPEQQAVAAPLANPADPNSAQMNGFYARVYIKEEGGVKKAVIAVEGSETMSYSLGRPNNPKENIRDANLDWFGNYPNTSCI